MLVSRDRPQRATVECLDSEVVPSISNIGAICAEESGKAVLPHCGNQKNPVTLHAASTGKSNRMPMFKHRQGVASVRVCSLTASTPGRVAGEDEARDANTQYIRRL